MYLWEDERRGSRLKTVPWLGSQLSRVIMRPCCAGSMIRLLEAWWYVRVLRSTSGWPCLWSPSLLAYCTRRGLHCAVILIFWKLECLDSSCSSTSAFYLDDVLMGSSRLARKASRFTLLLLGIQLWWIAGLHWCWLQGIEPIQEVSRHYLQDAEEVVRAGVFVYRSATR